MTKQAQLDLAVEIGRAQRAIHRYLGGRRAATMVDAGCGRVRPSGLLAEHVVGVDPDEEALAANPCIDQRILSSLEELQLPNDAFDVAVCWNVLEHLDDPVDSLARLVDAVRPGGLVVLALPNVQSVRGVVTKFTPTWFHTLVFRVGFHASGSDPGPYKTYMRWTLRRSKLLETARSLGLQPLHDACFEGYHEKRLRELRPVLGALWHRLAVGIDRLSAGYLSYRSDMILVFTRTGTEAVSPHT